MITRRKAFTGALALTAGSALLAAGSLKKLSKKELMVLVEKAKTPADHRKLSAYYADLATEFEAESKEHAEMAEHYAKNPTLQEEKNPSGGGTASHCRFFAAKYSEMAQTAKTMSSMHEEMAKAAK